ncbi:epoxyqueuosine reductase QueH [Campylobacter sp. 19-13652]|uniref:epoxyqueuosine reductase QueH n=1 Tax=Campylobacter sp. 19-13652 TaxID=2840180 RepID=UPI001C7720C2|nr:epoxyqueuosine reductase QueH [Campylobacter sp. 19-13652]BCX78800.1 hypothetical protein LBC_02620 [Campylobacter sp. 19-13652]
MLVHICCSVDSHYFLQRLRQELPDEPLVGYFYDPNIHPYSEYMLRYLDVRRSCEKLGVELILGEYDYEAWLAGTKGLENEPEKGARCAYCFDFRVGNSAKIAQEMGHTSITTTLLMSPKKDFAQLKSALDKAVAGTSIKPYAVDFRTGGGTNEQFAMAKREQLYHQNYCGCIFALSKQRQAQKLPAVELASELYGRTLPGSIEARLELYERVRELEGQGERFRLSRRSFLNYRLLRGLVRRDGTSVPSYFMLYSNFKRHFMKLGLKSEQIYDGASEVLANGVIFLSLNKFNALLGREYADVMGLCKAPPSVDDELALRRKIAGEYSLNPIIILPSLIPAKHEIVAYSELYEDSCEVLGLV